MTLRLRNTFLISLAAVAVIGLLFSARLIMLHEGLSLDYIIDQLPLIIMNIFTSVACIIIFFSFRNTSSSEIFFFYIYIFSFMFDIFRYSDLLTEIFPVFTTYAMAATRLVYYGRFVGALALFSAGLFTTGLEYGRMRITLILTVILPAALVLVLPVDVTSHVAGGTWEIGKFHEITISLSILHIIAVLNFLIAAMKNESGDYSIIAISLFAAICGREMIFYFNGIFPIIGMVLMLAGTISFGLRLHRLYLWD
ncbi:MAG: hypothetical protein PQJ61_05560 [Spirochaetales bacterium]|uniref:Uncharacterized protein n=1 Tax=Candidatus Thalassospirochaeta sargassi TaxID=3119039 RepID=A0AAJ1IF44_9SPIO|nr:hypothetical protein [Spirochaetales bacterium]